MKKAERVRETTVIMRKARLREMGGLGVLGVGAIGVEGFSIPLV